MVGERGKPCLTLILHLIFFDHPSLVLNLIMKFSYNLIAAALNSKGTFSSSNVFHRLFLGTVSKAFLKSTKQQKRLDLSLRQGLHSYPKCNEMVHSRVFPSKTCLTFSPLTFTFKPIVNLLFQNNTV